MSKSNQYNVIANEYRKDKLDSAYIALLEQYKFKWFITLTYKNSQNRALRDQYIHKDISSLHSMMLRKCFGKRYKNNKGIDKAKISMFYVIERGKNDNPHIHILLSDIMDGVGTKIGESIKLNELLIELWKIKISKEYVDTDCQEVFYKEGVISYMLKESGIDYKNINIDYL